MSRSKAVQAQIAYSRPEELTNVITHAIGAALGFVGLVFLMLKTVALDTAALGIAAAFIYGLSLTVVFAVSALCHAMRYGSFARAVFRRLDRCTVAALIFGAFAPVMLIGFAGGTAADAVWGYVLFAVVTVTAVLAVIFNAINATEFKAFSLVAYVIMGWACIVRIDRVAALCGRECFWFLLGGGLVYSFGIIFYAIEKIPFNHAIWHLFVLGGAAMHFVGIYSYLL